jgi:exosortase D (VPLPA-CTERM-specific)
MTDTLKLLKDIKPVSWFKGLLYAILIVASYNVALKWMILHDWAKEDYSHCYLIPFVVLYLIWEKREELASLPSVPSWLGLIPFGLGILLFWLGELGGEFFSMYMSFWLVIVGLYWLHFGWDKIKAIWFALVMMLAMFPFPSFVNVRISLTLKLLSSQLGVWLLHIYGMSAYREGNVIDLGFTQLQVVDACSGLRYLISLMVLSLILAYWFKAPFWKKAVLFLSSIPLTIVVNSFRIALTGVLYSFWGPAVAEGFFHGLSGWLIFMVTLGILLAEMWVLKRIGRNIVTSQSGLSLQGEKEGLPHPETLPEGQGGAISGWQGFLRPPQFVVAIVLLALTLWLSQGIEFREKIPIKQPLNRFPLQVGEWTGTPEPMEQQFIDVLDFSDYTIVNYKDRQGRSVNFYVAYYESQRKGESIHSPETCLFGGGWSFKEAGAVAVPLPGGGSMRINRAFIEMGESRQLAYYWFAQRGRVLTNLYQLKIYAFWDALTKHRTDGALVRVITPVYPQEKPDDAEKILQGFIQQVVPLLNEYIPG